MRSWEVATGAEKLRDLPNRAKPRFVHVDHHPSDDQLSFEFNLGFPASGWILIGKTRLVQAHASLDKAVI